MRRGNSKSPSFIKRKFKRTSHRKLSPGDILVLDFLWTWKVASSQMLKLIGYPTQSNWWAYKAIKQLEREKYIQAMPRGKNLDQEVWTLTQLGFEVVLMDRDDISQYRFKPHAPAHDYFATCLQLGDLWTSSWDKVFFTEQMLAGYQLTSCLEQSAVFITAVVCPWVTPSAKKKTAGLKFYLQKLKWSGKYLKPF